MYKYLIILFLFFKIDSASAFVMSQTQIAFVAQNNIKDSTKYKIYPLTFDEEKALMAKAKRAKMKAILALSLNTLIFFTFGLNLIGVFTLAFKSIKMVKEVREEISHYPENDAFKIEIEKVLSSAYLMGAIGLILGFFGVLSFVFLFMSFANAFSTNSASTETLLVGWISSLAVTAFLVFENMFFKTNNI